MFFGCLLEIFMTQIIIMSFVLPIHNNNVFKCCVDGFLTHQPYPQVRSQRLIRKLINNMSILYLINLMEKQLHSVESIAAGKIYVIIKGRLR